MIDPIKLSTLEGEIKSLFPIPYMYNNILGLYGNLLEGSVCCPFHNEKTPSFSYSPALEICSCFGQCSWSGDTIELYRFYMEKIKGLTMNRQDAIISLLRIPEVRQKVKTKDIYLKKDDSKSLTYYLIKMQRENVKLSNKGQKIANVISQIKNSKNVDEFIENYQKLLTINIK